MRDEPAEVGRRLIERSINEALETEVAAFSGQKPYERDTSPSGSALVITLVINSHTARLLGATPSMV